MKVKLFVLAALVLLSSINGIFFNNPIGISAQEYENVDDYSTAGINEMVEDYISYGNEEAEYSSYDNYDYSSNNEYVQDDYSTTYNPGSYEDEYSDNSYGDNYYPPKEPKKFTCADSGIVVDKEENCPLVCPAGTDLEGHLVAAGSNLQVVCDEDAAQFETCGAGTDLEGVLVANEPEDCTIFATCDANDPLGQALGLTGAQTVEVADPQLCELNIPVPPEILECPSAPTTEVPNLNPELAGASVTDIALCSVATPAVQCTDGTFQGVWVHPDQETEICDLTIPQFAQCEADSSLAQSLGLEPTDPPLQVADIRLCDLVIPPPVETFTCEDVPGSNLPPDAVVTDQRLCTAAIPALQCAPGSDLAGVWVNSTATGIAQCNISPADITLERNPQAQCLKCADLAALFGGNNAGQQQTFANLLIGTTTNNIFTICQAADPRPAFNALSTVTAAETAFDTCLDNAAVTPGTEPRAGTPAPPPVTTAPVTTALQENSLTTNIQSEAEIPTESEISTFSPPTIAQGVEGAENSSPTLAKMEKLKQQWLDQLP